MNIQDYGECLIKQIIFVDEVSRANDKTKKITKKKRN